MPRSPQSAVVDRKIRLHRGTPVEFLMPAGKTRSALAPILRGEAEIEIGQRYADGDMADAEGCRRDIVGLALQRLDAGADLELPEIHVRLRHSLRRPQPLG